MSARKRIDVLLVEKGLVASRARARDEILQGNVSVEGQVVRKPGHAISESDVVELAAAVNPYVSRGGLKLVAALDAFDIDPEDLVCVDIGASTGGFTDVLLKRGAKHVTAIDVGSGQLHPDLARNPRVHSLECVNARHLERTHVPQHFHLVVCDVSFISLTLALGNVLDFAPANCWLVALIKPQFEAGPEFVRKGGVVRDRSVHETSCRKVETWLQSKGWTVDRIMPVACEGARRERGIFGECPA